jgi:hypothetical protein
MTARVWRHDDGYGHEIIAAAVEAENGHVAWVESRQKQVTRNGMNWLDIEYA